MPRRKTTYKLRSKTKSLTSQSLDCPPDQDPFKGGPYYLDNKPAFYLDGDSPYLDVPEQPPGKESLDYRKPATPKQSDLP